MTPNEIKLVRYLIRDRREVIPREEIIKHVWEGTWPKNPDNNLKVAITYARGHLEHYDIKINNVRGVGYGIDPEHHDKVAGILETIIKRKFLVAAE